MLLAMNPTRPQCLDRDVATLAFLLLVVCTTACRADAVERTSGAGLERSDTVIEPLYRSAKRYNPRHGSSALESYRAPQREIIFLIDASGSMMRVLPYVIRESQRAVDTMTPHHALTVICFSGRGIYEVDSVVGWSGPRTCNPAYKAEVREWLALANHRYKTGGAGARFAEAAIVRALRYKPELIYLLTDHMGGGGASAARYGIDPDALLASIHAQNDVHSPAKINTICFVNDDPLAEAGLRGTLQRIADETDGQYKYIGKRDLNLR